MGKALMLQGTGSHVGKSLLTAALCRIIKEEGYRVAPFKSQNMALNSYVTPDGLEIGRAQALQAEACGLEAAVEMNPILLKPTGEMVAQVVVMGKPLANMTARQYREDYLDTALPVVKQALATLMDRYDLVVMEGAGSPAEINLRERDIVNMRAAKIANAPVLLIGDIDRGGVFASLYGTLALLYPEERDMVKGLIVNKFRGDLSLFDDGVRMLEDITQKPVLGVVPFLASLALDEEDSVVLDYYRSGCEPASEICIAVPKLPRLANFTDFAPLGHEHGVRLTYVTKPEEVLAADAVILPGTKNTVQDLKFLEETGLSDAIFTAAARGTTVVGICGGYQMLGQSIHDPHGVETGHREFRALGLLPVNTVFKLTKHTVRCSAFCRLPFYQGEVTGYEVHMGESSTSGPPAFTIGHSKDGCAQGEVWGTYIHGIFDNDEFRWGFINHLRGRKSLPALSSPLRYRQFRESELERLANHVRKHLSIPKILKIAGLK